MVQTSKSHGRSAPASWRRGDHHRQLQGRGRPCLLAPGIWEVGWWVDENLPLMWGFPEMGGTGVPKLAGVFHGKSHRSKWMMTGGSPISGNLHILGMKINRGIYILHKQDEIWNGMAFWVGRCLVKLVKCEGMLMSSGISCDLQMTLWKQI